MLGRGRSLVVGAVVLLALASAVAGAPGDAASDTSSSSPAATLAAVAPRPGPAARAAARNPLANRPWLAYQGPSDDVWVAYDKAKGRRQQLLSKIVLEPRTRWYGDWIPTKRIRKSVHWQLVQAAGYNPTSSAPIHPDALIPLADFRLKPWEGAACHTLPTAAQKAEYQQWTREFARGIGDFHVSVVLQPDGPFALCAPHGSRVLSKMLGFAVRTLSAHHNTSVYIDAGASDWLRSDPGPAVRLLARADVADARGFALNSTHYASTADQLRYGAAVVKALARRGIRGKHFVVNTAANGRPFNGYSYHGPDFDNAKTCRTTQQRHCVTLGIPPTADVANPAWGLPKRVAQLALKYCDGYQWIGRPWLFDQATPFVERRALDLVRTSPYASLMPPPPLPVTPPPTVTGVLPPSGTALGGTMVTVTGTGFASGLAVKFGTVWAKVPPTVLSPTVLTVPSPPHDAGPVDVTVVRISPREQRGPFPTSATSPADQFVYVAAPPAPPPAVTAIRPSSGSALGGTGVVLTGSGFAVVTGVSFGGTPATTLIHVSDTQLVAYAPPHDVGPVDVTVSGVTAAPPRRPTTCSPISSPG